MLVEVCRSALEAICYLREQYLRVNMSGMADWGHARLGVKTGDSKALRDIDHAVAWTFNIAKDLKPGTISRSWIAKQIKRSESFVTNEL